MRRELSGRLWAAASAAAERRPPLSRFFSLPSLARSTSASPFCSASAASPADVAGDPYIVLEPLPPPPPKSASIPTLLQPRVVIYDGVCHLCHRGVKWVIKADKYEKIKFCCLQSKAAEPYLRLCGVDREDVLRRFLFIEGPDAYYEGSTAALKVASYLPPPYSALSALGIIPAPLRDLVYDYVAKRRYDWFGREGKCLVMQDREMLERFIDRDEMLGGRDDGGGLY